MTDVQEMFKKECEELGIDFSEFPFDFPEGAERDYPTIFQAMMWILKKRQDKTLSEILETLAEHGRKVAECSIQR